MENNPIYTCTILTKEEFDKSGMEEGNYDYEAKMIGKSGIPVIQGAFKVYGDIATILNKEKTHYVLFNIKDPKNKEIIWFEELNPVIKIISKAQVYGATLNTKELLEALKNKAFKEDGEIMIQAGDESAPLTLVYKCTKCEKIHLFGGYTEKEVFNNMIDNCEKVYINYTYDEEQCVGRIELIEILETFKEPIPLVMETVWEENNYTVTTVFKCSVSCPVVHLDCTYENNYHMPN